MIWKRLLTGAVLIPVVVAIVLWSPAELVAVLALFMTGLALLEFFAILERAGLHAYRLWTLLSAAAIFLTQWHAARPGQFSFGFPLRLDLVLFIFVLGLGVIVCLSRRPLKTALGDLAAGAMGLLLIALPLSTSVRLVAVDVIGPKLLLFALVVVWVGDTMAYFVGKFVGRWHMAPQLSPAKTWEGAAANLLGAVIAGVAFAGSLAIPAGHAILMAGLASVAGQIGDLLESAYKRSAGVKDSGTLLPGHGGMLDRIDALILAAPVVWYYFSLVLGPRG